MSEVSLARCSDVLEQSAGRYKVSLQEHSAICKVHSEMVCNGSDKNGREKVEIIFRKAEICC